MIHSITLNQALAVPLGFAAAGAVILAVMLAGSAVVSWIADRLSRGDDGQERQPLADEPQRRRT